MKSNFFGIFVSITLFLLLINISFTLAHGDEDFTNAEEMIKQKISCDELNESQLEILGDYFMEQMHPGEAHEIMDERMGGEGSESLRLIHINMGKSFYCGEHGAMSGVMMNRMMDRGMMSGTDSRSLVGGVDYRIGFLGSLVLVLVVGVLILILILIFTQLNQSKKKTRRHKKR